MSDTPSENAAESLSPATFEEVHAAKRRLSASLLGTPGVAGVGIGDEAGRPVLQVYCLPESSVDLPEQFAGVPVRKVATESFQKQ